MKRRRLIWGLWLSTLVGLLDACGGGEDVIIKTADGVELTAQDIDKNPMALLPAGAGGVFHLDAPALFASPAGAQLLQLTKAKLPVPQSAGFVPERDLKRLLFGLYSFQGVDFVGVATGTFDLEAIEKAADGTQTTPLGSPLVRVEYAGRVFYVSANLGFVALTNQTVLFGNETGIRRALDRLEAGRVQVELSSEIESFLQNPGAPMAFGSDSLQQPHVVAMAQQVPALQGMRLARVVGNFDPPGLNFAGTLTYESPEKAQQGQAAILKMHQDMASIAWIASVLGMGQPVQKLDVTTQESSAQFTLALDSTALTAILQQLSGLFGVPL